MKIKHMTQICILIAVIMLFAATSHAAYDPSLKGYWKFDETSGGTAYDSTDNDNDGTITGATKGVSGQYGTAFSFDGNSDYVDCGNASSLGITDEITISAWVKPETSGELGYILDKGGYIDYAYGLYWNGSEDKIKYYRNPVDDEPYPSDAVFTEDNQWAHAVMTIDTAGNLTFYHNGTSAGSHTSVSMSSSTLPLLIGDRPEANGDPADFASTWFDGLIDEVAIWDKALNAEQVENLYSWGVEGFEASGQIPEPVSALFALAGIGIAIKRRKK